MQNMLQGWKTIIVAVLALVWAALDMIGISVPLADQEAIATAVFAVLVIIGRVLATGPVAFLKKKGLN